MNAGTVFDFSTSGDWTLLGDGEIASSQFSLEDPLEQLYWNTHRWSSVPTPNGDGDYPLVTSITYKAHDDGSNYEFADYAFVFWLKMLAGSSGSNLYFYMHYTASPTDQKLRGRLYHTSSTNTRWYSYMDNLFNRNMEIFYSIGNFGWAEGAFKKIILLCHEDDMQLDVADGMVRDKTNMMDLDDTDGGTVAFFLSGGSSKWVIGGGGGSSTPNPYVSERKQGGVQLKEASALDLANITSLDRIALLGDLTGGGDLALSADLRYNHYNGMAWGGWTAPAADGDISALSCGTGKKLLVGITDGSAAGLDTMCAEALASCQTEHAPIIDGILVTHTEPSTTNIGLRLGGYTGGPNRGARE